MRVRGSAGCGPAGSSCAWPSWGRLEPHGRPGARLSRQQGGVVRGRLPADGPLPRRALRRPGPRQVDCPAATAWRVHPGEAHGRLPGGRGRGQPGPARAPRGPRLGLGAVLGVRHRRAHPGPHRLLHLDVRAVPRPLRALDQQAPDPAHPAPRRPAPEPGRQVLVRVPAAHARAARTRLARPLGTRWPKILERVEKVPRGDYPTSSLRTDAAHGAWLYRDNVRPRLRRPRPDAYAHAPVQLVTPLGDAFLSERLYDELELWAPGWCATPLTKHWVPGRVPTNWRPGSRSS